MKGGSCPLTRIHRCPHCKVVQQSNSEIAKEGETKEDLPLPKSDRKRTAPRLSRGRNSKKQRHRIDIFSKQEGRGRNLTVQRVSPIQAAVDQAKSLLAFKRKCKGKACELEGMRASKVYNRKRNASKRINKRRQPKPAKRKSTKPTRKFPVKRRPLKKYGSL